MKKKFLAIILASLMSLSVLTACSSSEESKSVSSTSSEKTEKEAEKEKKKAEKEAEKEREKREKANKFDYTNALIYLTNDNEWVLSKTDADESIVINTNAIEGGSEGFAPYSWYIPGKLTDENPYLTWFSSDKSKAYYFADVDYDPDVNSSIYCLDMEDLNADYSNIDECISLICEDVLVSCNNEMVNDGIVFRTINYDLYYYNGEKLIMLDKNVDTYRDDDPADGQPPFTVVNNGNDVLYLTETLDENGGTYKLRTRALDGNSDVITIAENVHYYYCDSDADTVFYETYDRETEVSGAYVSDLKGNVTTLMENNVYLKNTYGNTAYYIDGNTYPYEYYFYDGTESHLSGTYEEFISSLENDVCFYIKDTFDEENSISASEFIIETDEKTMDIASFYNGNYTFNCWYLDSVNDGRYVCMIPNRNDDYLFDFIVADTEEETVEVLAEDCWFGLTVGDDVHFFSNYENKYDEYNYADYSVFRDGEVKTVAEYIEVENTCYYEDDVIFTNRDGELLKIENGEETHVANEVGYFLRLENGNVLYTSLGGLFVYDGENTQRIGENATFMASANAVYTIGTAARD